MENIAKTLLVALEVMLSIDIVNDNVYTKFGLNLSIRSSDIEQDLIRLLLFVKSDLGLHCLPRKHKQMLLGNKWLWG